MKGSVLVAICCSALSAAAPAFSQPRVVAPATPPPSARLQARHQTSVMEDVLERAVQYAALRFNEQLRAARMPDFLLAGAARAHGTRLEGYGVFFDLEVPFVRESLAWSFRIMRDRPDPVISESLSTLRAMARAMSDLPMKTSLESLIGRLEARIGPAAASSPVQGATPRGGNLSAASLAGGTVSDAAVQQQVLDDPAEIYTNEVRKAVIEAMLDHSGPITLGSDEWLAVAARDGFVSSDPNEVPQTMIFRVRGADLGEFRAGRLSREEAVTRVEVKDF